MGGYASGRHGGTVTAENTASYVLNITSLRRAFQKGQCLTGSIHFDEGKFPVVITVDLTNEWNCFVELIHRTRDKREGDRLVTDRIQLTWTEPTYGGRRAWFLCPRTARRTMKLFLPNGGSHFWSRQAHDLGYACQREVRFSRLQRRAAKLNRQLGGKGLDTWDAPPPKPKWMRWKTYDRKLEAWIRAADEALTEFAVRTARLSRRI
jgi:hypothetical protein